MVVAIGSWLWLNYGYGLVMVSPTNTNMLTINTNPPNYRLLKSTREPLIFVISVLVYGARLLFVVFVRVHCNLNA